MAKLIGKSNKWGNSKRPSTASSFREIALNANSLLRRNTQNRLNDKEKVPISDEQIIHMIKNKTRGNTADTYEIEPKTYEEKLIQSKFIRSTEKY